ncbi:MAG: hypothetical protein ACYDCN_08370 [Bacteroidia bacterium]
MKTIWQVINKKQFILLLFTLLAPLITFADEALSPKEVAAQEAATEARWAMIGEIAIGVIFAVAVTAFIMYKTKHDKKEKAKHIEIMKKVQATRPAMPTRRRRRH